MARDPDPSSIRDELREKLRTVHERLRRVWEAQAELEAREEELKRQSGRYETTIRLLEEEFGLERSKVERFAPSRARIKTEVRKRERTRASPVTAAEAVDNVIHHAPGAVTAVEIHERIARSQDAAQGVDDVASIRTILSRYARRYGWLKTRGERPARWRKRRTQSE